MFVTLDEYLMGRQKLDPITPEMELDAYHLIERVNRVLYEFGEERRVSSGYRPPRINSNVPNAAPRSNHTICKACDLEDKDGRLDQFCIDNFKLMEEIGLWLESPTHTPGWCHLQSVAPRSGNRIFIP